MCFFIFCEKNIRNPMLSQNLEKQCKTEERISPKRFATASKFILSVSNHGIYARWGHGQGWPRLRYSQGSLQYLSLPSESHTCHQQGRLNGPTFHEY